LEAVAEYDGLGQDAFLRLYGFGRAREYELVLDQKAYDSKAILGAAHRYATGTALTPAQFSGGEQTVRRLTELGFDVRRSAPAATPGIGGMKDVAVGQMFPTRAALTAAGVHRATQAGIVGTGARGAESIVVSGGYEDDQDDGDVIIYTGHGGRDGGRQVSDQSFDSPGNAALLTSSLTGAPVRVSRGAHRGSVHAPPSGYRYDGLFRVDSCWREPGRSGYLVCRYRLTSLTAAIAPSDQDQIQQPARPGGNNTPDSRQSTVQRIVRSSAVADYVKTIYDHTCQFCSTRLAIGARGYSEGAHIRPLGKPHNGPDTTDNILCLCPNCHVLFDNGAITIHGTDLHRHGQPQPSPLTTRSDHPINPAHTDYHRNIHR
jgi:predicted restriction endonuclease